ncbi:hypothetical protein C2E23DRAFT_882417 [Lenzites betulinus]|nr:hypothetical protein C2E23DRAFT_882417 [Lenzites betulinus]
MFWPYADVKPSKYPDTWDEVRLLLQDSTAAEFLCVQHDAEIALNCYSVSFSCDLLPGMYSMPVHVVPKPRSMKFQLVNDHSARKYLLNSMIHPEAIKGVVLDGIPALGDALCHFRRMHPQRQIIMWKSNVLQAYRRMPVSLFWQVQQVVTIDGDWIAEHYTGVPEKFNYVDDNFGFALAHLLCLWDKLSILRKPAKQLHRLILPIIGLDVDPNTMTVTLPAEGRARLLNAINNFCNLSPGNWQLLLADFQAFTGYTNWVFNTYPLLKPALSNIYEKMAGKSEHRAGIYVNSVIIRDLQWMKWHILCASTVHFLKAVKWTPADLVQGALKDEFALTDAPGLGLGVFFPWLHLGFYCDLLVGAPTNTIFFFEALGICSAIHRARTWHRASRFVKRLAVLSNNLNSVAIFSSLRTSPLYNTILHSAMNVLVDCELYLRIDHILGDLNIIADTLSRGCIQFVCEQLPRITLLPLLPPQDAMGDVKS